MRRRRARRRRDPLRRGRRSSRSPVRRTRSDPIARASRSPLGRGVSRWRSPALRRRAPSRPPCPSAAPKGPDRVRLGGGDDRFDAPRRRRPGLGRRRRRPPERRSRRRPPRRRRRLRRRARRRRRRHLPCRSRRARAVRGCEKVKTAPAERSAARREPDPSRPRSRSPIPTRRSTRSPTPTPAYSDAYLNRNWTPTAYDTCPKALHDSYSVVGPDGKLYPGLAPADGDQPGDRRALQLRPRARRQPAGVRHLRLGRVRARGARVTRTGPGSRSATRASSSPSTPRRTRARRRASRTTSATRSTSPTTSTLLDADGRYVTAPDPAGGGTIRVACDYLTKVHQGSHSADATTNNAHELLYAVRCNDGTELLSVTLSRFGDAERVQPLVRAGVRGRHRVVEPAPRRHRRHAADRRPRVRRAVRARAARQPERAVRHLGAV